MLSIHRDRRADFTGFMGRLLARRATNAELFLPSLSDRADVYDYDNRITQWGHQG